MDLKTVTNEELQAEIKRRGDVEWADEKLRTIRMIENDLRYIKAIRRGGAPGSGSYEITFDVRK